MFSIPSVYELGTCSDSSYDHNIMLHQTILSSPPPTDSENPKNLISPTSMAEAKALAASNTHKEAERQRRKRINAHIATLKSILPTNIKTDKASLLGEAVRRVKELKKKTAELQNNEKIRNSDPTTTFPNETDEVKICRCEDSGLIKVTLSCEDRPDIIMDMIQALKAAEAKAVRAEMSTVGGRTNNIVWVKMVGSDENDVGLGTLRRAMRMVMDKSALLAGSGQGLPGNKRPRYYHL